MSSYGTTKTSSECLVSMSDEERFEWSKNHLIQLVNKMYQLGKLLEYRYQFISFDLLEANTLDELDVLNHEIQYGLLEVKRSVLLDRLNKGADMIRNEKDESRIAKMEKQYEQLQKELNGVDKECYKMKTKY